MSTRHEVKINRRRFLRGVFAGAVGTVSFPYIVSSSALGRAGNVAPSSRITMGSIGVGGMGTNNMRAFLSNSDVQVVAVCDVTEASNEYGHWYKKGWQGEWFGREPARKIVEDHLYKSDDHHRNFLDCIKTNRDTAAPVEVGHRSVSICHLGNIAMTLKRKLQWDPENESFVNDESANQMLARSMRSPWHL